MNDQEKMTRLTNLVMAQVRGSEDTNRAVLGSEYVVAMTAAPSLRGGGRTLITLTIDADLDTVLRAAERAE